MHELRDDALERELSRLSEYTGEPASLWEDAIDAHRRERDRRLWVWVRRPAPALAAAGLSVLVASIALRPAPTPALPARGLDLASGLADSDVNRSVLLSATTSGRDSNWAQPSGGVNTQLPREITQNSPELDFFNARYNVPSMRGGENDGGGGGNSYSNMAGNPWYGDLATKSSVREERAVDSNAGARTGTEPSEAAKPAVVLADRSAGGAGSGRAADYDTGLLGAAIAPSPSPEPFPPPTATLTLGVPDVNHFYYKALPSLVNEKSGEELKFNRMLGKESKDAAQGVELTLHVNENRVPEVVEQLKKEGKVQVETEAIASKETRLAQIDARLESTKRQVAQYDEQTEESRKDADKSMATPEAAAARLKAQDEITNLNRRRNTIVNEGELATINIVAVPEQQVALKKAAQASAGAPAAGAPPSGENWAGKGADPSPPPPPPLPPPSTPAAPIPPPLASMPAAPTTTANKADSEEKLAVAKGMRGGSVGGGRQVPAPAATPAEPPPPQPLPAPSKLDALTPVPTKDSPAIPAGAAPPSSAAAPLQVRGDVPAADAARKQLGRPPSETVNRSEAPNAKTEIGEQAAGDGKIRQAAREGWSSLGDSIAGLVRGAIATALYWVPGAAVGLALGWWWRKHRREAVSEPPPE